MVQADKFDIEFYFDNNINSTDYDGYEYEQCYSITGEDEVNGQTAGIICSRFQRSSDQVCEKLVALKFITKEYLSEDPKHSVNLEQEIKSLRKCKDTNWCLQLHEVIQTDDCMIIVTDLIHGLDLFMFRTEVK